MHINHPLHLFSQLVVLGAFCLPSGSSLVILHHFQSPAANLSQAESPQQLKKHKENNETKLSVTELQLYSVEHFGLQQHPSLSSLSSCELCSAGSSPGVEDLPESFTQTFKVSLILSLTKNPRSGFPHHPPGLPNMILTIGRLKHVLQVPRKICTQVLTLEFVLKRTKLGQLKSLQVCLHFCHLFLQKWCVYRKTGPEMSQ